MPRTLYIAEKPSVANAIAAELGIVKRGDGCLECRGGTTVTWCFGHLFEQAEPDAYLPESIPKTKKGRKIWRLEDLPIFPQKWLSVARSDKGVKKQIAAIGRLIKNADLLVNAGDPDREGQLLVDEVIEHFKALNKPVKRFWVSAVDPASIRKGLAALKNNQDFTGMRDAARGRSRADWLLGMNLSRAYTLTNRSPAAGTSGLITVGRVQTPTLTMVAQRDYAVRNFKPVPFLVITADLEKALKFRARWQPGPEQKGMDQEGKRLIDLELGRELVERLSKEKTATVLSASTKHVAAQPPRPYSLASMQTEANRLFGFTAQETLDALQSLYERHKIVSYPRTDCEFLPTSQHAEAPSVLAAVAKTLPAAQAAVSHADSARRSPAFNDKKVTAHHGIVPVANAVEWSSLNRKEQTLYRQIARRYIAQFYPPAEFDQTEIKLDLGGETFAARGKVLKRKGWKVLFEKARDSEDDADRRRTTDKNEDDEKADDNQTLPSLQKGDVADVLSVDGREALTKPPAYYTEGTLIAAMENVWRSFADPKIQEKLKEAGGIGTPATRAAIIGELKRRKFLVTEGKHLHCSPEGRNLLLQVSPKIRSAVMTAAFEERLKAIELGRGSLDDFVRDYEAFVRTELDAVKRGGRPTAAAPQTTH